MSKEAMKLALEALEYIYEGANKQGPHTGISWRCVSNKAEPAITALREALAKPDFWEGYVPEPVKPAQQALDKKAENARELGLDYEPAQQEPVACANGCRGFVKYPAQRKPLTDEQWQSIADTLGCIITRGQKDAIQATIGIKENT